MRGKSFSLQTLYVTLGSFVFMISGYIVNIWLGRHLGPVEYGVFGVVLSLWNVINLVLNSGLPQSVTKFVASDESRAESILKTGLYLQLVLTIIVTCVYILFAPLLASMFNDPSLTPYIRLSGLILLPYSIYAIYSAYFAGLHDFFKQTILNIVYSILKIASVVGLVILLRLNGVFIGYAIAPLLSLLIVFHIPKASDNYDYKSLVLFSLPTIALTVFFTLQQTVGLFFVKTHIESNEAAGLYTAIQNIAYLPYYALSAFGIVLFPSVSRYLASDKDKIRRMVTSSSRVTLLLLTPLVLGISAASSFLLKTIYTDAYSSAAPALSILIIAFGLFTIARMYLFILNGAYRPYEAVITTFIGLLVSVFFSLILVKPFGLVGAATASVIGALATVMVSYFYVQRSFGSSLSINSTVKIIFAAVLVYLLATSITVSFQFIPLFYSFLSLVYLFLLYLLKEIGSQEWYRLTSSLSSLINKS